MENLENIILTSQIIPIIQILALIVVCVFLSNL